MKKKLIIKEELVPAMSFFEACMSCAKATIRGKFNKDLTDIERYISNSNCEALNGYINSQPSIEIEKHIIPDLKKLLCKDSLEKEDALAMKLIIGVILLNHPNLQSIKDIKQQLEPTPTTLDEEKASTLRR